jgi:exonuclease VII small subunit
MNTNTPRNLLFIIIGVLVVNLAFNLFGSGKGLKEAVRSLETARKNIDTALLQLNDANSRLDSIQQHLKEQEILINDIHVRAELLDLEHRKSVETSARRVDSLKKRIAELKGYTPPEDMITFEDLKSQPQ